MTFVTMKDIEYINSKTDTLLYLHDRCARENFFTYITSIYIPYPYKINNYLYLCMFILRNGSETLAYTATILQIRIKLFYFLSSGQLHDKPSYLAKSFSSTFKSTIKATSE